MLLYIQLYFKYSFITKYWNLQKICDSDDFKKLQKTFKAIQTERDMLLKKMENNKLIQDYSSDNDVST